MEIEKNVEHEGWSLGGRCREVQVSYVYSRTNIIYGQNREEQWYFVIPSYHAGGDIGTPDNIGDNEKLIGESLGNKELGKILAKAIAEDYTMLETLQKIVQQVEMVEDIPVEKMEPGKLYGIKDYGYCSLIVSCQEDNKIYFLRMDKDEKEYIFAYGEEESVECWPMEYLKELLTYKEKDYEMDTRTLYGLYDFASTEVYNLSNELVDYGKRESISTDIFADRIKLNTNLKRDLGKSIKKSYHLK